MHLIFGSGVFVNFHILVLSFFKQLMYTLIIDERKTGSNRMSKREITIIALICFVIVAVAAVVFWQVSDVSEQETLALSLTGERVIYVEIGQEYAEPGVSATLKKGDDTNTVEVSTIGQVDTSAFGTYMLKYTAQHKDTTVTDYRRVHVVDTQGPVITLVASPDYYTMPDATYVEEGFTAVDNYDGDITDKVIRTETREKVTYTVADTFGNTTTVERTIVYWDTIPPVLTVKGQGRYTMTVGQQYVEEGCTAIDNCNGDISQNIQISGEINRYTPGEYVLTYSATDSYGNVGTASRVVCVEPWDPANGEAPKIGESNGKTIYLTFDDGPGPHTPKLLSVLRKYNVRATFFVMNTAYIGTIVQEAADGHTIACHTSSHQYKRIYASEEAYFKDLEEIRTSIANLTGIDSRIIRFPGGSSNSISSFNKGIMTRLTQAVQEQGFAYFDWDVDSMDAGGAKSATTVFKNVTNGISKSEKTSIVVLQHDIKSYSVDAVEGIIVWGLEHGYAFRPLSVDSPACQHNLRN